MYNIAFVNWIVDCRNAARRGVSINMVNVNGLIMHNLWLYDGGVNWSRSQSTNVSIRDCTFYKDTIDATPIEDLSDVEIRFTYRMSGDWGDGCSLGPIEISDDLTWTITE